MDDDLLTRLNNDPDATEADVLTYLRHRAAEFGPDFPHVEPEVFFRPGDLGRFRDAERWWPADAPPVVARPLLGQICRLVVTTIPGSETTFMGELERQWLRCCAWLRAEDRSVEDPNEDAEERRRRRNREAVARHRAAKRRLPDEARGEAARLYRVWMDLCAERKAAHQAVDDDYAPRMEEARAAWAAARTQSTA